MNLQQPSVMGIAGVAESEPDTTDPTVVSATSISATLVDVLFDEAMDVATIQAGDFSIDNGLTVSGAVLQGDDVTVRLTTSSQTPSTTYTVTVSTVSDIAGNPIGSPNSAQFTGYVVAAGILFESSWNTATGTSDSAINDGTKWIHNVWQGNEPLQDPFVAADGPGGYNYLSIPTPGGGGSGNPYAVNWWIDGDWPRDIFYDPDDLYIRVYFRMHQTHVDNFPGSNHNFMGAENNDIRDAKHPLNWNPEPDEWPELNTPFVLRLGFEEWNAPFIYLYRQMETERWYCFEIHVHKVDASSEAWYIRLDGEDVTSEFISVTSPHSGKTLTQFYNEGFWINNEYWGTLWIATYDNEALDDGYDLAAVEVRDDTWPGLL